MHFSVLFICAFKVQNNFLTNGLCNKFFLTCKDRNVALLMNNLFHKCHTPNDSLLLGHSWSSQQ